MRNYNTDACENIDAAVFNGDDFHNEESRKELREYMKSWEKELKSIEEMLNSEEYKKEMQE